MDNKKVFTEEQHYTTKCEACNLFCKIDKYRSCEARHRWNSENGIDVFAPLAALDNMARAQQGFSNGSLTSPQSPDKPVKKTNSRHRGRK